MTHDEMIEVIAAHRDGKQIEVKRKCGSITWARTIATLWNFAECDYRIAEPKWRDATIDDLKRAPLPCRVRDRELQEWANGYLLIGYMASGEGPRWIAQGFTTFWFCQVIDEDQPREAMRSE